MAGHDQYHDGSDHEHGSDCFSRQSDPPTISMTVNYLRPVPMWRTMCASRPWSRPWASGSHGYCETIVPATERWASLADWNLSR